MSVNICAFALAFVLALVAQYVVDAHPICIDSKAPFRRANAKFSRCSAYNNLPTCAGPAQEAAVVIEPTYQHPGQVPEGCRNRLRNIACASLDQWSGHLFRAEGAGEHLDAPMLCESYCTSLYESCSTVPMSESPFVQGSSTFTTMAAVYGSKSAFCAEFADPSYCFNGSPFTVPKPQPFHPSISICVERVLQGGGVQAPRVNMQPVPGYDNLMMIGDLSGKVRIFTVDNTNTGEAFTLSSTLIDITSKVEYGGEMGLLGVALHKQFKTNGRFYVSFSCAGASANINCARGDSIIDEYRVLNPGTLPLTADVTTRRRIFRVDQPYDNHNGGHILFSPDPDEPNLFLTLGDGGAGDDPENRAVRLHVHYGLEPSILTISMFYSNLFPVYTGKFFVLTWIAHLAQAVWASLLPIIHT